LIKQLFVTASDHHGYCTFSLMEKSRLLFWYRHLHCSGNQRRVNIVTKVL